MSKAKKKALVIFAEPKKNLWSTEVDNESSALNFDFKAKNLAELAKGPVKKSFTKSSEEKKYKNSLSQDFFSKLIK